MDHRVSCHGAVLVGVSALLTLALASACAIDTGPREAAVATSRPAVAPLVAVAPAATAPPGTPALSNAAPAPTKVIVYYPLDPGGDGRAGSCWSNSLAVPSRDAWRCNAGNEVLDPCFDLGNGRLVCGPNPLTGQPGTLIRLSEPLSAPNLVAEKPSNPWLLELEDGSLCSLATGATGQVDGKRINYLCSLPGSSAASSNFNAAVSNSNVAARNSSTAERAAVLGEPKPGTVWTAEKAVVASREGKLVALSSSVVPLRTVVKGPAQRVLFEPGATSASFQRTLQAEDFQDFVLWAFAGQTMIVDVAAPKGEVSLDIVGRSTGDELRPDGSARHWQGKLPATQDYRIRVAARGGPAEYQLVITIPATLQLAPAGQPATLKGRVKPGQKVLYLLEGMAEQRVAVSVTSPEGKALLAIYGLPDGASLVPAVARTRSWEGVLPQQQDYVIEIGSEGAASDYTLQVAVR